MTPPVPAPPRRHPPSRCRDRHPPTWGRRYRHDRTPPQGSGATRGDSGTADPPRFARSHAPRRRDPTGPTATADPGPDPRPPRPGAPARTAAPPARRPAPRPRGPAPAAAAPSEFVIKNRIDQNARRQITQGSPSGVGGGPSDPRGGRGGTYIARPRVHGGVLRYTATFNLLAPRIKMSESIPRCVPTQVGTIAQTPQAMPSSEECVLPCFALMSNARSVSCCASAPLNDPGSPPL